MKGRNRFQSFCIIHPHLYDGVIALFVAFFIALFCSMSLSPLYAGENPSGMNMDSNLFRYCAYLWLNGGVPYVDFFDHKGLYHLAIDVVGLALGGRYGIWALEILFYWIDLLVLLPSVRLLFGTERRYRVIFYLIFAALQGGVLEGNMEGEWVLPFVSLFVSAYVFGIKTNKPGFFWLGSFMMGLDVGCALNSRPVDGIYGVLGAVFCLVYCLRHRAFLPLLENALVAILGCAIPFAIFYSMAYAEGFLRLMVEAVFVQNISYLANSFVNVPLLVWGYKVEALLAALILSEFFWLERRQDPDDELAFFFFSLGVPAALVFFVICGYGHYFQSGFGFLALALLYGLSRWPKIQLRVPFRVVDALLCLFLSLDYGVFAVGYYTPGGIYGYSYRQSQEMAATISEIKQSGPLEKGSVFALDVDCAVYLQGDFIVGERYLAFQKNWSRDNPSVATELTNYLSGASSKKQPEWLLVSKSSGSLERFIDVINANYTLTSLENSLVDVYRLNP